MVKDRENQAPSPHAGITMQVRSHTRSSPCITAQVQNVILIHSHTISPLHSKLLLTSSHNDRRGKTQFLSSEPRRRNRYTEKYSHHSCLNSRREKRHITLSGVEAEDKVISLHGLCRRRTFTSFLDTTSPQNQNTNHMARFLIFPCFFGYPDRTTLADLGQKVVYLKSL